MAEPRKIVQGGLKAFEAATKAVDAEDAAAKAARMAALIESERALPLRLARAPAKPKSEIAAHAERVGRQMLGEHITSGKPGKTANLAGRSKRESERVKNIEYEIVPTKDVPASQVHESQIGDINVAFPGDYTLSDVELKSLQGVPIGSKQEGGSRFGLGKLDMEEPLFWASNEGPAQLAQDKATDVFQLYEPNRVMAHHLAMGRTANNFAQHFADASLRAIDYSKLTPKDMNLFDSIIAGGYTKKNQKTGKLEDITFPHWPGIADPESAMAAMKADPELRKWFLNRMKTPSVTEATKMPNGLDIEWAITSPDLRNLEVNLTGHSVGQLVPGAKLTDTANHQTYSKGIQGRYMGHQGALTPFVISFPDAAQHISSTQRPQDFTGTIQKVFPHQIVDQQYLDELGEYKRQLDRVLTGKKKGGPVKESEKDMAEFQKRFALHKATGGKVSIPHLSLKKADGGKIAKGLAKALETATKAVDAPAVNRLDMNFKDVTKRVPELTEAANKLAAGELSPAEYDALVNKVKPVTPYSFVPQPATAEDAMRALTENKRPMFGKTGEMTAGEQADLRLDIPAYKDHGVWVNSIHRKDAPTVYGATSSVKNATMIGAPDKALKVAQGGPKAPFAVIRGEWNPMDEATAVKNAQKYLNHKDWRQVGYDPERHGYFYDRATMEPITNAEEVIQIGPLVLAKKPVFGKKSEEKYADGGKIFKGALSALQKATKAVDAETAAKKIEAPAIIVPSKISNVKEAVRRSEGDYGARRVERAADEVPNLEKIYQEEALRRAFTGDNAKALMTMNPRDFEKFAMTIPKSAEQPMMYRGYGSDYHTDDMKNMTLSQYIDHLAGISGGYDAVPFLQVGKKEGTPLPFIKSHEGRHRNRALAQQGEKTNLIELLPTGDFRESLPRRSREEYIEAVKKELGPRIVTPQQDFDEEGNKIYRSLQTLPDIYAKGGAVQHDSLEDLAKFHERFALHKATGGKVNIPHLSLKRVKKFDGGGMAVQSPEETVTPYEGEKSRGAKIAEKLYELAKEQGKEEVSSLKKPRAATDLLNRGVLANNPVSATVDFLNWGLGGVDAAINAMRSPTMSELVTGKQDKKYLSSEKPFLGSEQIKDLMNKYGVTSGEERPLMETALSFLSPTAVIKGAQKTVDVAKKAPEMVQRATDAFTSSKLSPLATEAKTASAGKPTGATYATKQEGPFFRVRPTSLDQSTTTGRGVREADELQGTTSVGGGAGSSGSTVPTRLSDEEVARIIADPAANEPLNIAKKYTQETQGAEFTLPDIPESSLVKQSAIGRAHQLAVEGTPEYKSSVFDAYAREMPEVLEQAGAKNYDDLMEKAYRQLAKETDAQFQALPYNFSYHRAGEGNYNSSKEMAADVHGNKHLYVFQGGDPHDFLNRIDPVTGLNENEKFRAVHDLLGHAIYGNQFGPKGEEVAWAIHSQMYSPLARLAMTAETRGQNSMVNYSPLNAALKAEIAKYDSLASEARRRGDTALLNEINAAKRQAYSGFQYAPQKAVLLPPEFLDPKYAGGMPSYLEAANRPAKGTETQSVLTHFSHNPELQFVDPKRYGTGIKGAEAERLRDFPGGVRDRAYFYMGEPGAVSPEPGLGVNRYRGEASSLYDITQDPLNFRVLARESNRTPYTAKYNQGITSPLQEANDMERLVKEYGYQGMANPKASKPMAIMFKETPVRRNARGGLTLMK